MRDDTKLSWTQDFRQPSAQISSFHAFTSADDVVFMETRGGEELCEWQTDGGERNANEWIRCDFK